MNAEKNSGPQVQNKYWNYVKLGRVNLTTSNMAVFFRSSNCLAWRVLSTFIASYALRSNFFVITTMFANSSSIFSFSILSFSLASFKSVIFFSHCENTIVKYSYATVSARSKVIFNLNAQLLHYTFDRTRRMVALRSAICVPYLLSVL